MSLYVFDTDILTLLQEGHPTVYQRVEGIPRNELAITIISVEEQLRGWYTKLRRAKNSALLAQAYERLTRNVRSLAQLSILSFSEPAIMRFEHLKTLKLNVPRMDLCIAAITLEHGGILVTRNLRDFQRVPNLQVEDWSV